MTQLILITPKRKIFQFRTPDQAVRCVNEDNVYMLVLGNESSSFLRLALATRQLSWRDKRGDNVLVGDLQSEVNEQMLDQIKQWGEMLI